MTITFPAPEEVRTWPEYVQRFRQMNPGIDAKKELSEARIGKRGVREHFDWCWQQPEAEAIYEAFR